MFLCWRIVVWLTQLTRLTQLTQLTRLILNSDLVMMSHVQLLSQSLCLCFLGHMTLLSFTADQSTPQSVHVCGAFNGSCPDVPTLPRPLTPPPDPHTDINVLENNRDFPEFSAVLTVGLLLSPVRSCVSTPTLTSPCPS